MAKYETTLAQIVFFKWADDKGVFGVLQKMWRRSSPTCTVPTTKETAALPKGDRKNAAR